MLGGDGADFTTEVAGSGKYFVFNADNERIDYESEVVTPSLTSDGQLAIVGFEPRRLCARGGRARDRPTPRGVGQF